MSQYTTGEIAKMAGVTVRTVQYYDSRGILIPSDFSEGGRRLYNDKDLQRLRIICFLRDLGIQINDIAEILSADNAEKVINLLMEQQLVIVQEELAEYERKRDAIVALQKEMKNYSDFTVENLSDIANVLKNRKKLKAVRKTMIISGIMMEIAEITTFIMGIIKGVWWPFFVGLLLYFCIAFMLFSLYYNNISYICPECHEVFKPTKKDVFFANHTPTTRKLKCTCCGHHGFCVETYQYLKEV